MGLISAEGGSIVSHNVDDGISETGGNLRCKLIMSRSIHTTRRTLGELRAEVAKDPGKAPRLEKAEEQKTRKRLLKRHVSGERQIGIEGAPQFPLENIEIEVLDEKPNVVHGASREDLLAVLDRLPRAAREGISTIQLSLGIAYQKEKVLADESSSCVCDPIYGRPGGELFDGVYIGETLGFYQHSSRLITLFAFVVDETKVQIPATVLRFYLKLHALRTFAHEVAHHHDHSSRVGRGRWLADREDNVESYAAQMEQEWLRDVIIPYLESAYAVEVEVFLSWLERLGGLRVTLGFFSLPMRVAKNYGRFAYIFCASSALESWIGNFSEYSDSAAYRIGFADELHYAERYAESLMILEALLKEDPERAEALTLKADVLVHEGRFDEAEEIVKLILVRNPNCETTLGIRGDILVERKEWQAVLDNSRRLLDSAPADSAEKHHALMREAVAYCALGKMESMEARIKTLMECSYMINETRVRKAVFRRAGKE